MKRATSIKAIALVASLGTAAALLGGAALAHGPGGGMGGMGGGMGGGVDGMGGGMGGTQGGGMMQGMGMGGGMMPRFEEMDADGDGKVSREELQAWRAARFAAMDADGDGKLTRDEIVAFHQAQAAERFGRMADRMIGHQDADGDGAIGPTEFGRVDRMGMMFDRIDRDGDGSVDADEIAAMRERHDARRGGSGYHRGPRGDNAHWQAHHGYHGHYDRGRDDRDDDRDDD